MAMWQAKKRGLSIYKRNARAIVGAVISSATVSPTNVTVGGVNYDVYRFITGGNLTISSGGQVEAIVVGGGGGGGSGYGGGGGAGGLVEVNTEMNTGTYFITIGSGGAGAPGSDQNGSQGSDTTFSGYIAKGGGYGGGYAKAGANGGSGGGGSGGAGSALDPLYGNNGASGYPSAGGGAGSAASGTTPGAGKSYNWTGTTETFAAGGGVSQVVGPANTGNGGGSGGGSGGPPGAAGGSGVVLLRVAK